jgi:hypothetical protein
MIVINPNKVFCVCRMRRHDNRPPARDVAAQLRAARSFKAFLRLFGVVRSRLDSLKAVGHVRLRNGHEMTNTVHQHTFVLPGNRRCKANYFRIAVRYLA